MNFFFENLSLLPETSAAMEHFKLVFGSGNSDLAKIRPLKVWTSWSILDFPLGSALLDFASFSPRRPFLSSRRAGGSPGTLTLTHRPPDLYFSSVGSLPRLRMYLSFSIPE